MVYTMVLFMSPVTSPSPRVYRKSSYGTGEVIRLCFDILWRSVAVIGMVIVTYITFLIGLGIITISDLPRIIDNFWTGSKGSGSPL